jgi:peptide/nickel transport system permease protein
MGSRLRNRIAILIAVLAGLHLILLCAGFVAPYDPATQNRDLPYAPPTRLHFKGASGFHWRPFVYRSTRVLEGDQTGGLEEDRSREYRLRFLVSGPSYKLLGIRETTVHLF